MPDDVDVYFVLDDFGGRLGRAWPEVDEERTDRETLIADLLTGQYHDPVRVVAFNTAERWSRDVSEEIAYELLQRATSADREFRRPLRTSSSGMPQDGRCSCRCRSGAPRN
jgi:hypothetical protein